MIAGPSAPVPRRPAYPGSPVELSALTLDIAPLARPASARRSVGLLRKARSAGIVGFDVTASSDPFIAEALLREAFPEPDPAIVIVRGGGGPARSPGVVAQGRPRAEVGGPRTPVSVPPKREEFCYLEEIDPRPGVVGGSTVIRCGSTDDLDLAARAPAPRLLSGPFSVLDRTLAPAAEARFGREPFAWIARDPFAGGRMDGGRFAPGAAAGPAAAPQPLRELAAEFERVAPFSFLVRPRSRTLAQASLQYLVGLPWVATVVIPPPPPERWAELVGFGSSPPLSEAERERVDTVTRAQG
jgi:aryl-alcohol dehydrogenase-like predicted oxidoreductase